MATIKLEGGQLSASLKKLSGTVGNDRLVFDARSGANPQEAGSVIAKGQSFDAGAGRAVVQVAVDVPQVTVLANVKGLSKAVAQADLNLINPARAKALSIAVGRDKVSAQGVEQVRVMAGAEDITGDVLVLGKSVTSRNIAEGAKKATGVINFGDIDRGNHEVVVLDANGAYGTLTARVSDGATTDGVGKVQWTYTAAKGANGKNLALDLVAGQKVTENFILRIRDKDSGQFEDVRVSVDVVGSKSGTGVVNPRQATISGKIVDGYVSGATVFVDYDADGIIDPGAEAATRTTSDAQGGYSLVVRQGGGIVTAFGGTDTATNQPSNFVSRSPPHRGWSTNPTSTSHRSPRWLRRSRKSWCCNGMASPAARLL